MEYEKMFIAYQNVIIMLKNRGYDMSQVPCTNDPVELATRLSSQNEFLFVATRHRDNDRVAVFFCTEPKLGVKNMRDYKQYCETTLNIIHWIVLTYEVTPFATAYIQEQHRHSNHNIEVFTYDEKQFDLISHARVPPHSILTEEEKANLLKRYYLKDANQLPHRRPDDKLRRYYNLPVGTVTKTMHSTGSMEPFAYYRIVVDDADA